MRATRLIGNLLWATATTHSTLVSASASPEALASLGVIGSDAQHSAAKRHLEQSKSHHRRLRMATSPNVSPLQSRDGSGNLTTSTDTELHSHAKRASFSGRASFFAPGLGACGTISKASDYMVALNQAQYGDLGAVSSWCFQTITITYGASYASSRVRSLITDFVRKLRSGCPYGALDLSPSLFSYFANPSVGVFYMSWSSGGSPPKAKTTTTTITTAVRITTTTTNTTTTTTTTPTFTPSPSTTQPLTTSIMANTTSARTSLTANSTVMATVTSEATTTVVATTTSASSEPSATDASSTSSSTAPTTEQATSNLDTISQLVLAMGNLAAAAVQANA
ncbi:BQ2448_1983 [Microbotryum intermedium]|uniref:BQ2448_1983 protein n=1 Tax=Microbotryum intermedium TaxID=269621 RepID=A0A238FAC5_9BASI|nr:BQ2448_1983 [Microbotryum intermedium]